MDATALRGPGVGSAPRRQLRVEPVMGTVVSIDIREPFVPEAALDRVIAWFHDVDERFSPFLETSEISRLASGSLRLDDASPDVRSMLTLCETLRQQTDGYFDATRHRADRRTDPSGVVKGWSVDEAISILRLAGARNAQVVAGGDMVVIGSPEPGRPWRIGIRHPESPARVAAVLATSDLAFATSGLYERGGHIVDPRTGLPPAGLRSLTVVGPTLALADAYATAGFAMGAAGPAWVAGQPGYGVLAITDDDRVRWSDQVDALLVQATPD